MKSISLQLVLIVPCLLNVSPGEERTFVLFVANP